MWAAARDNSEKIVDNSEKNGPCVAKTEDNSSEIGPCVAERGKKIPAMRGQSVEDLGQFREDWGLCG